MTEDERSRSREERQHRVAAIDCGTNSIRLLIADPAADGTLVDVVRDMRIVRLGQGVDRTGRLAAEAIERTRHALVDFADLIRGHGASAVRMVATSATRDAANRDDFTSMVRAVLGVEPEVVTGDEEAALSFVGAVAGLPGLRSPLLVADIGGGSTELVLGVPGAGELRAHSMDVGCVRMTERHLHDDPPTPGADQGDGGRRAGGDRRCIAGRAGPRGRDVRRRRRHRHHAGRDRAWPAGL